MKTNLIKLAALLLLSTLNSQLSTVFAQGSLTPPGAPAPTMKTLDQIEARTPISSVPFTITQPGSYYLTTNLTTTVSNAIVITTNGVTLDLGGWTISSTVANAANGGTAILLTGTATARLSDITIFNGHIRGGVTNNGSGVYSGNGFANGISYSVNPPVNVLVSKVSVSGCLSFGIYLATGDATVVEGCTVRTIGGNGILASTVKSCVAVECGGYAIYGDQVSDCRGESTGSGAGIFATYTASGCYGSSSTGAGLYAYNASFCTGDRLGGRAIQATIATGCIAYNGTNLVTYKYNMP